MILQSLDDNSYRNIIFLIKIGKKKVNTKQKNGLRQNYNHFMIIHQEISFFFFFSEKGKKINKKVDYPTPIFRSY